MKQSLQPGLSKTVRIEIGLDRTIDFMGEEGRVYATPMLVRDIEQTCRGLLLEHADAGAAAGNVRMKPTPADQLGALHLSQRALGHAQVSRFPSPHSRSEWVRTGMMGNRSDREDW